MATINNCKNPFTRLNPSVFKLKDILREFCEPLKIKFEKIFLQKQSYSPDVEQAS